MGRLLPAVKRAAKTANAPLSATRRAGDLASLVRLRLNGVVPVKAQTDICAERRAPYSRLWRRSSFSGFPAKMRTIGLIGGMSWQSSRLYYDRINQMTADRLGGAHSARIILNSLDFDPIAWMQTAGQWREAGALLANSAQALERAGADCIAIGANTMHKVAEQVKASVAIPLIHIGDTLAAELRRDARTRPLLLGTRYTMEDPFLIDHLERKGIGALTPEKPDRDALHAIIYDELIKGIVTDKARETVRAMIRRSYAREADSVIFGCTEIGMLFPPTEAGLPGYDTLELHAAALVDFALA